MAALLIMSVASGGLAGAVDGAGPGPRLELHNLKVLDDQGNPFPRAGIMAWPVAGGDMIAAGADADGSVGLSVDPTVEYEVTAFAINTRWCGGWINPATGDRFHFSEPVQAVGADLARPTTFVVAEPRCTRITVLDGEGQPFAQAGAMAWPVGGGDMITGTAGPDGTVELIGLDPDVEYEVTAYAIDTGWTCGYWTNPHTGAPWWFSTPVVGYPGDIDGTTLTITEPDCP